MKILVVCGEFPYPADHGLRVDVWGRIVAMVELGWRVHLAICGKQSPPEEDIRTVRKYVEKIIFCNRSSSVMGLLHLYPLQIQSRRSLQEINVNDDFDFILLEGEYVYPVLQNPKISRNNVILRVHNNEFVYFKGLAKSTNNSFHKLYYLLESMKFAMLQHRILKKIDKFLFISNKEYEDFKKRNPTTKCRFLPPPVKVDTFQTNTCQSKHVVFIGSLFMPNNKEAIQWYLTHIHPLMLNEPDYQFIIAGNSRQQSLRWLENYNLKNVTIHDTPKSLDDIYKNGYLFVNSMQNGAGVKLKTIEAIQNGLPVISTSIGCEGTGLVDNVHLMIADRPEEFYRQIKLLFDNYQIRNQLVDRAQEFLRIQYDHKRVLKEFVSSLSHDNLEQLSDISGLV